METGLLHLHSFLRWAILLLLLMGIFMSIGAGSRPFGSSHKRVGTLLTISCDITLLLGLYQWATSGYGLPAIQTKGMAAVMQDATTRFFAIEHIVMMLIAIILVHIGKSFGKKNVPDRRKHRKTVLFYVLALIIMLAAIPWPFREIGQGRGWL